MPGVAVLDDGPPAEREPVRLAALLAGVAFEQLPERDGLTLARQFVLFRQVFIRKGLVLLDVSDRADGQGVYVHVVQRVVAAGAGAVFVTEFVVS
jgi:hypothetical protein